MKAEADRAALEAAEKGKREEEKKKNGERE